jgi:hypothetical protein
MALAAPTSESEKPRLSKRKFRYNQVTEKAKPHRKADAKKRRESSVKERSRDRIFKATDCRLVGKRLGRDPHGHDYARIDATASRRPPRLGLSRIEGIEWDI